MPREIFKDAGFVAPVQTTWSQLIPATGTVPSGEVYVVRVSLANVGTAPDTVRLSLLDSTDTEVATRLPDTSIGPGEIVELSARVPASYKLSVRGTVGGQVHALVIEGVRQF